MLPTCVCVVIKCSKLLFTRCKNLCLSSLNSVRDYVTRCWCVCNVKGLKTGMYYLRTRPAANAIQFTVDKSRLRQLNVKHADEAGDEVSKQADAMMMCSLQNKENCVMCSSWTHTYLCSPRVISPVIVFTCRWWTDTVSLCTFWIHLSVYQFDMPIMFLFTWLTLIIWRFLTFYSNFCRCALCGIFYVQVLTGSVFQC